MLQHLTHDLKIFLSIVQVIGTGMITEQCLSQILFQTVSVTELGIISNRTTFKVIFSPARKLRNIVCNNRPYDKRTCIINSCKICPLLITENKDCEVKNVAYKVTCKICNNIYIGETCRRAHERLGEHLRYAKFPLTPFNISQAFAIHYNNLHRGSEPNLEFEILKTESNTARSLCLLLRTLDQLWKIGWYLINRS